MQTIIFFCSQDSFLAIFTRTKNTSTTPNMAGSLQTAAQTNPNPINTITNASATGGSVVVGDLAIALVTITVEAAQVHGRRLELTYRIWTEG